MIRLRALLFNLGYFGFTGLLAVIGLPLLCRRRWVVWYSERWTGLILAC